MFLMRWRFRGTLVLDRSIRLQTWRIGSQQHPQTARNQGMGHPDWRSDLPLSGNKVKDCWNPILLHRQGSPKSHTRPLKRGPKPSDWYRWNRRPIFHFGIGETVRFEVRAGGMDHTEAVISACQLPRAAARWWSSSRSLNCLRFLPWMLNWHFIWQSYSTEKSLVPGISISGSWRWSKPASIRPTLIAGSSDNLWDFRMITR